MHFTTLIQTQKSDAGDQLIDEKGGGGGGSGGGGGKLVPRQFMDLGLATNTETDEPSMSSSDGDRRSRSPGNTGEVASSSSKRHSPDQGSNWGSNNNNNKVPKFSSSSSPGKDVDQTEATMRKARVSVRARSEAPMVLSSFQHLKYHLSIFGKKNQFSNTKLESN